MTWTDLAGLLSAGATSVGVVVAWRALNAWRQQSASHERKAAAERLLAAADHLRDAFDQAVASVNSLRLMTAVQKKPEWSWVDAPVVLKR